VPHGCSRSEVFDEVGLFDERLIRNQDYELNRRLARAGKRVWFSPAISAKYYNQATLGGLFKQAFGTGKWNPWMWFVAPYSFAPRHAVPGLFVLSLLVAIGLTIFFPRWGLLLTISLLIPYISLSLFASFQQALRYGSSSNPVSSSSSPSSFFRPRSSLLLFPLLPPLFLTYHLSYGLGTLWGALRLLVGATPVQKVREPWPGAGRYRAWPRKG